MITNRVPNTTHQFITVQTKEIRVVSRSGNPGPGSVPKTRAQIRIFFITSLLRH